jgi:hypothetical protein
MFLKTRSVLFGLFLGAAIMVAAQHLVFGPQEAKASEVIDYRCFATINFGGFVTQCRDRDGGPRVRCSGQIESTLGTISFRCRD